jgi:hypothetical protein
VTPALSSALEAAKGALASSADGAIERAFRERIWTALDHRGRSLLAIACAVRGLAQWFATFPNDETPDRLIDLARAVLAGEGDRALAIRERDKAWTHVDDLDPNLDATVIGYAAAQALGTVLFDDETTGAARDSDVSPEAHDAGYLVSLAEAGGPVWQPSERERRRRFWTWWLEQVRESAG